MPMNPMLAWFQMYHAYCNTKCRIYFWAGPNSSKMNTILAVKVKLLFLLHSIYLVYLADIPLMIKQNGSAARYVLFLTVNKMQVGRLHDL
jgi:hypothetical protein